MLSVVLSPLIEEAYMEISMITEWKHLAALLYRPHEKTQRMIYNLLKLDKEEKEYRHVDLYEMDSKRMELFNRIAHIQNIDIRMIIEIWFASQYMNYYDKPRDKEEFRFDRSPERVFLYVITQFNERLKHVWTIWERRERYIKLI